MRNGTGPPTVEIRLCAEVRLTMGPPRRCASSAATSTVADAVTSRGGTQNSRMLSRSLTV
ncbi:hypothetical protein ACFQX6_44365 [Streptosporangium lutulentum]